MLVFPRPQCGVAASADEAQKGLINCLKSIVSLDVSYEVQEPGKVGKTLVTPDGSPPAPSVERWLKQGNLELHTEEPRGTPPHRYAKRWAGFDGKAFREVLTDPGDMDSIVKILVHKEIQHETLTRRSVIAHLLGFRLWESHLSLLDLIDRKQTKYLGTERVGDSDCEVFDFGEYAGYTPVKYRVQVWVDPTHDFLPRQIQFHASGSPGRRNYVVDRFMSVADATTHQNRFFPEVVSGFGAEVHVTKALINQVAPISEFVPDVPIGVPIEYVGEVIQSPDRNQFVPKMEINGGDEGVRVLKKRIAEKEAEAERSRPTASGASVPTYFLVLSVLAVGAVLVAKLAVARNVRAASARRERHRLSQLP